MDLKFFKKSKNTIIFLIVFSAVSLPVYYKLVKVDERLPVYSPCDINPRLVDDELHGKTKNHRIASFRLVNQNGDVITNQDFKDKIYIADFFFTSCQTICLTMATHMKTLQNYYIDDPEIMFLSHSVTPAYDRVPILRAYADKKGIIDNKWHVTTGDKKHIYELARKSYFAVLDHGDGGQQDFIHTENFILIDKQQRIRGMYDGTKTETIQKIIDDIALLKDEYQD